MENLKNLLLLSGGEKIITLGEKILRHITRKTGVLLIHSGFERLIPEPGKNFQYRKSEASHPGPEASLVKAGGDPVYYVEAQEGPAALKEVIDQLDNPAMPLIVLSLGDWIFPVPGLRLFLDDPRGTPPEKESLKAQADRIVVPEGSGFSLSPGAVVFSVGQWKIQRRAL